MRRLGYAGYVLFSPLLSGTTCLVDTSGHERMPHHDVALLPCGKVLAIVWERKTREGASRRQYHNPFSGDAPNPAGDPPHSVFRATFIPPDHPAIAGRNVGR